MTEGTSEAGVKGFHARQVKRPRAQVEEQLRQAILHGTFKHGERLPSETELAHEFGISRPTLREALGSLASAGLIRRVPGVSGGNFVNGVTPDSLRRMLSESMNTILRLGSLDVDEVDQVRRLLEVPAARWAASNRSAADLIELKRTVELERAAVHDDPAAVANDLEFHELIGRSSGNRLLAAFVSAVHEVAHQIRVVDMNADVAGTTTSQHASILAAIEASDAAAAADLMSQHLDYVLNHSADSTDTEES